MRVVWRRRDRLGGILEFNYAVEFVVFECRDCLGLMFGNSQRFAAGILEKKYCGSSMTFLRLIVWKDRANCSLAIFFAFTFVTWKELIL